MVCNIIWLLECECFGNALFRVGVSSTRKQLLRCRKSNEAVQRQPAPVCSRRRCGPDQQEKSLIPAPLLLLLNLVTQQVLLVFHFLLDQSSFVLSTKSVADIAAVTSLGWILIAKATDGDSRGRC